MMKYLMIIILLSLIACASAPEEVAPAPYMEASKEEAKPELTQEEKETIDKKLENLKKLPIRNLIENIKVTKDYEKKQSWAAIEEVLNRKLLALLKKEFPKWRIR